MVDILFLGTGGGRVNLIRQRRGTGGFLLLGRHLTVHVDPGPGALLRLHAAHRDPAATDCIIVTHMHIDHVSDANVLIEAMTGFMLKTGGTLISARSVVQGDKYGDKSVSSYHQSKLVQNIILDPNGPRQEIRIRKRDGSTPSFFITPVPVKHDDKTGFGFVLEMDGVKIGYTSDTEYLPAVHDAAFSRVDALVANLLKPAEDGIPDHLHSGDLISLLRAAQPKLCLLSHMGMKLLQSGPEAEAARIAAASGVPTQAGRDGQYYCTDRCGWFRPEKESRGKEAAAQKTLFSAEGKIED